MAFSRDSNRLIGGKKTSGMKRHIHMKNLGKAANAGTAVGQTMIANHKGKDYSTVATMEHQKKQMRKHGITL